MKIIKVLLLIIVLFIAGAHEIYSDAGSGSTSIVVNVVPTVSGQNVSSITATGATLGANVTSLGVPAAISARGTCWGSSTNPTTNCVSAGGTTTGTYSHARSGMSCNTAYYYRGYATNTTGTGYSTTSSFTTSACPLPTPTNFTATTGACGTTTLTLSWNASAGATAYVLYRNGTAAPISSGSSSTSFTDTGLTAGTTYTYRVSAVGPQPQSAEATTSGTVAAACPANAVPTVTTPTVSSITTTGATLGANVTNLGYPASISARGTCWGSSNNPTTNCASASGTTTGTYSHSRTGMSCNTLYYYRGYATNTTGTGYSASSSFTTSACPVMSGTISSSASSCTISAGSSSCNVTIDWSTTNAVATSAVTASGMTSVNGNSGSQAMAVPYSSRTFYLYNNSVELDSVAVTSSCASGTTWNGSTCATNTAPTVSSPTVSSITTTGATLGANVTSLGLPASISARGTCWGTSNNPTTNCTAASGTTTGTFTHSRTGMSACTPYYYRGYATNSTGTGYSASSSFTTACVMSGTISASASSCTIASGGSSCNVTIDWSTTNAVATSAVTASGMTSVNGNSGSQAMAVPYSSRTFYLYNNSVELDSVAVTSSCASGTTWNGSTCATNTYTVTGTAGANGSISPATRTVNHGSTTTFTVTPNSGYNISSVTGCSGSLVGNTYTTGAITSACTVTASFSSSPVNGVCSTTHYSCNAGTSANNVSNPTNWTWNCNGTGGGTNASCSENKVMSGTISSSASSCTIASGGSSCNVTIDWSTTNPVATSAVTATGMTTVNGNSGSQAMAVPYSSRTFYLYNNSVQLDSVGVTSSCASGNTWNGSSCAPSACANGATNPPTCNTCVSGSVIIGGVCTPVTVSVTASPTTYNVSPGATVSFAYTASTNSGSTECRLLDNAYGALTSYQASSPISYSAPSVTGAYGYYVQCRNTTTTSATATSGMITVNVASGGSVPIVASPTVTSINTTSATLGANITSLGSPASVSARGTCWGTSTNPTTNCLSLTESSDSTNPTVTAFTIPSTSSSLTVPVSTFTATDNTGVTGYALTESSSTPSATTGPWYSSAPSSYTFVSSGTKTLYAWARDAAGNVSSSLNDSVTITISAPAWQSGLVSWWKLDGNAQDSISTNNGTITGATLTSTNCKSGQCYTFDGTDYISIPDSASLDLGSYTISAWIYPTDVTNWGALIGKGITEMTINYVSQLGGGNIIVENGHGTIGWAKSSSPTYAINNLYHVIAIADASTSTLKLYRNGSQHTYSTQTWAGASRNNNDPITIGYTQTWPAEAFKGNIDEVMIWNRALSDSEISSVYNYSYAPSSCVPESSATTCSGACGTHLNNCGTSVDCGACTVSGGSVITTGAFSHSRTGLTSGVTYYYRGYAVNATGTGYSPSSSFTTTGAMSGTLSASGCTIPEGGNSCTSTIDWTTANPVATSTVRTPNASGTVVATANSGSTTYTVTYPSGVFVLVNNGVTLDTKTAIAACAFGTAWNGSQCVSNAPVTTFTANPSSIFKGGSSTLIWNSTADSCTSTGTGFNVSAHSPTTSGSIVVSPLVTTVYTLQCSNVAGTSENSVTTKVITLKIEEN